MSKLTTELVDAMEHTTVNFSWSTMDVLYRAIDNEQDLTLEQAEEVLGYCESEHDANEGINWDIIDVWIDHVLDLTKRAEAA